MSLKVPSDANVASAKGPMVIVSVLGSKSSHKRLLEGLIPLPAGYSASSA